MSETPIARRVLERMRRQVRSKVVDLAAIREGNETAQACRTLRQAGLIRGSTYAMPMDVDQDKIDQAAKSVLLTMRD